jgi:hypothetical protein
LAKDTSIKLRLGSEELERWKAAAAGLGVNLSEFIRGQVNRFWEAPGVQPERGAEVTLTAVAKQAVSKKQEYDSIEHIVAKETGHALGHECIECMGYRRFLEEQRKQAVKE